MKIRVVALAITLLSVVMATQAQAQKFGYTNPDYILAYMPDAQTVQTELKEYEGQLTAEIQSKYQTLQQKVAEYEQNASMMIDAVRAEKEQEIQKLQQNIQQFNGKADQLLQTKQYTLLQPLYNKIQDAINAVAEENGYTYVFNSSSLLYAPQGDEISILVFKKLGIEPPAQGEGAEPSAAPTAGGGE